MEVVETVVKTPKEITEFAIAIVSLGLKVKDALKDGAGVDDIPKLIAAAMSPEVQAGLMGLDKVPAELAEDKVAFALSFAVAGIKASELLKK